MLRVSVLKCSLLSTIPLNFLSGGDCVGGGGGGGGGGGEVGGGGGGGGDLISSFHMDILISLLIQFEVLSLLSTPQHYHNCLESGIRVYI